MPGANLSSKNRLRLQHLFWRYMTRLDPASGKPSGRNKLGRRRRGRFPTFVTKGGAPIDVNPNDAPDRIGQILIDYVNKDVYLCTSFVSTTDFVWVRISD